jgi:hypothetical protein
LHTATLAQLVAQGRQFQPRTRTAPEDLSVRFAHIIHPVEVPATSDLTVAQPITYSALLGAREYARGKVDVSLLTTKYHDEDPEIPEGFEALPDLTRSVQDIGEFKTPRKLALLRDILQLQYEGAEDADYLIYTNVDIAPVPHFYVTLAQLIEKGHDGIIINRRVISDRYKSPAELPLMYAAVGRPHPGFDCFVYPREAFSKYRLGDVCIGTGWVGTTLLLNLAYHSKNYKEFKNLHMTFHVGDSPAWLDPRFVEFVDHNWAQMHEVIAELESEFGPMPDHPVVSKYVKIIDYRQCNPTRAFIWQLRLKSRLRRIFLG